MTDKLAQIRLLIEHAERPLHPYLGYCEYLLERLNEPTPPTPIEAERFRSLMEIESVRDLIDAARAVCEYHKRPSMTLPTRQEVDMIDWLAVCVRDCEVFE